MTVLRIKHNRENPYVQINKVGLFDSSISLKAKGLWAQCLARPDDWQFHVKELATHCKEGERAIYSAIDELIENGYALRIDSYEKGEDGRFCSRNCEYIIYEFKLTEEERLLEIEKFKKSFRNCSFGRVRECSVGSKEDSLLYILKKEENNTVCSVDPETGPTLALNRADSKNDYEREASQMPEDPCIPSVKIKDFSGQESIVKIDDLFKWSILKRKNWTTQEIQECWKILCSYKGPIRESFRFCEGTIEKMRVIKQANAWKNKKQKEEKCQTTYKNEEKNSQNTLSVKFADRDTLTQIFEI